MHTADGTHPGGNRNSKLPFSIGNLRIRGGTRFPPKLLFFAMHLSRLVRRGIGFFLPVLLALLPGSPVLFAQTHPQEITPAESTALPYRLSGQLNVTFGRKQYFGTSSYIRRYTGVTAGHLLYDPQGGLAVSPYYLPAFYGLETTSIPVSFFAVLGGYQAAANVDPDSNGAFAFDMGYVLFSRPAPNAEWAAFADTPDALTSDAQFLVLGYAAENFPGDELAFISTRNPFYQLVSPGLYENTAYYTEEGMSGGPTYDHTTGSDVPILLAVTVAGTDPPDPALSDVRAITPTEQTLFIEAEYTHGLISGGVIRGPATVAPGGQGKYKTGVVFADGVQEGRDLTPRYDELVLQVLGAHRKMVSITKVTTGKFKVKFSSALPSGSSVKLGLLRNTTAKGNQAPLKTMTVAVQ